MNANATATDQAKFDHSTKTILVTGATGDTGRPTVKLLLSYKLCQLKTQFEQAEAELSMRRGESKLKKLELEDVYRRMIRLESEFQRGGYYPDLLDEQIVILPEDLRLILADPGQTGITEPLLL